jgi:hypothetical protein
MMFGDSSLAYIEAFTLEKVCFVAGPESGPQEGHLLTIVRALYGLQTSGTLWHDPFANLMHLMGFSPFKAVPDFWMHDCITRYEYGLVYVDNIMFIGKEPQQFFYSLINDHGRKLKGVNTPTYHLGGDFYGEYDGTLAWGAHSNVSKMINIYDTMFVSKPKEFAAPMSEKDHPESYSSDLLDAIGIKHYQAPIGSLQWSVTLGRFAKNLGVATMSTYCCAPHQGNLDRLKLMYSYLCCNPSGAIRFCVIIPNH